MTRKMKGQTSIVGFGLVTLIVLGFIVSALPADHRVSKCTDIPDNSVSEDSPKYTKAVNYLQDVSNQFFGLATCDSIISLVFDIILGVTLVAFAAIILPG